MRRGVLLTIAAVSLMGSAPAVAASAGAAKASAEKARKAEKKVCKRIEQSNSRMAEKVCLTKAEWAKVEAQN